MILVNGQIVYVDIKPPALPRPRPNGIPGEGVYGPIIQADNSYITRDKDGVIERLDVDGTKTTWQVDGTIVETHPNGNKYIWKPNPNTPGGYDIEILIADPREFQP